MKKQLVKVGAVLAALLFLSITVLEPSAQARVGGSRSLGSSGSRSYSRPVSPSSTAGQYRPQAAPAAAPFQQQRGGFLRSMAGGVMGGMLGSMLFSSVAGAGGALGGARGGGIGIFEILLLAGVGYLIYRYIKNKREQGSSDGARFDAFQGGTVIPISSSQQNNAQEFSDLQAGLAHIRQSDPAFEEKRFADSVMDNFFKIQGGWMNRDLSPVAALLTDEMKRILQADLDTLLRDKQVNRLENIAVRNVEVSEAWQEAGEDYVTALIYANLLDYTTDETSGKVVSGSKTDPVKFEEYWTFTRAVGNNSWRLSAINQN
jgi:predicted lipid-binding transport protein (Tim44 family)